MSFIACIRRNQPFWCSVLPKIWRFGSLYNFEELGPDTPVPFFVVGVTGAESWGGGCGHAWETVFLWPLWALEMKASSSSESLQLWQWQPGAVWSLAVPPSHELKTEHSWSLQDPWLLAFSFLDIERWVSLCLTFQSLVCHFQKWHHWQVLLCRKSLRTLLFVPV